MSSDLFKKWLKPAPTPHQGVTVFAERTGTRTVGLKALKTLLANHFIGEETILKAGGYKKAGEIVANSLPTAKKTQSGDLGELLATEYVNSETPFVVPINKLRWKSDRQMAMHGNDVIGIDRSVKPVRVLKCECKSRQKFGDNVAKEAVEGLDKHEGRPNPSTLAFITKRLYEEDRDDEAKIFQDLQCASAIVARNITHMIFALAGNDPAAHLANAPKSKHRGIKRENAAVVISDHGNFITAVYKTHGT